MYHIFIIFGVIYANVLSFPWMNNKKDGATKTMEIYNIPKDDLLGIPLIVLVPTMFIFSKGSNNKCGWKHGKVV